MPDNLIKSISDIWMVGLISGLAGLFDYLLAVQAGSRAWSIASFSLHICFCVFVGYLAGLAVVGLGHSPELAGAAGGAAALLNERLLKVFVGYIKARGGNND